MEAHKSQFPHNKETHLTPDHVGGLSLKETTQRYGSLGLYTKMQHELERAGIDTNQSVQFARDFALTLHANDYRTSGHYTDHLMRVTTRILSSYKINDPVIIASALLHDSVEDHPLEIGDTLNQPCPEGKDPQLHAIELLRDELGDEIASIVAVLTTPSFDPHNKQEQYYEYTKNIIISSPKGRVIKLSDFVDNAVGNHFTVGAKRYKLDKKYLPMYGLHKMGLFLPDSLITGNQRLKIVDQLQRGQYRTMGRLANSEHINTISA